MACAESASVISAAIIFFDEHGNAFSVEKGAPPELDSASCSGPERAEDYQRPSGDSRSAICARQSVVPLDQQLPITHTEQI